MQRLGQQAPQLSSLALERIADWIVEQGTAIADVCEEEPTRGENLLILQIENIRSWLYYSLPNTYHDILAALLVDKLDFESCDIAIRMLETTFTDKLTRLKLVENRIFHSLHFEPNIQLSRLTELTFSPSDEETAVNLLQNSHELRYLCFLNRFNLGEISSNNMHNIVRCVIKNCPLLEHLKLVQFECVDDTHIDILIGLAHLRSVDLRGTGVSREGIRTLLLSCENLNCIKTDNGILEEAVELIAIEHPDYQFKLLSFRNSRRTTLDQMMLVVTMCPHIVELQIDHHNIVQMGFIALAVNLQALRAIELHNLDFYDQGSDLQNFLEKRGRNLLNLHLKFFFQLDLGALNSICRTCPNLAKLTIENGCFEDPDTTNLNNMNYNQLIYLRRLYVKSDMITDDQLCCLLSCCPNVEVVTVRGLHISDELMSRVLERNPLTSLQEWTFDSKFEKPSTEILEEMRRRSDYTVTIIFSSSGLSC